MNDAPDILSDEDFEDRRGHKGSQRRCVVTGQSLEKSELIRFVLGPDGTVVPDINEKLPGRGVWVSASRFDVEKAIKTKAFSRGFKKQAQPMDDMGSVIEDLLARKALGLMTMGLKSGKMVLGFDQVKSAARSEPLAWRIEASDGSEDGRGKIRVLTRAISRELGMPIPGVIGCFTASELGKAFGRDAAVHAAVKPGGLAASLSQTLRRLSGFRPLVPPDWPDTAHEGRK